ncbi:hypothetical protein E0L35_24490 [Halomonas sp. ATBC28]|uniref:hypothetical protein n=1 Tax=Halomonas sp. ATBC28 TaxID=2545264 RepID=UPI00110F5767|nr:hypothetical protein [Halomonas sp. ATBC28]TMU14576.1 hypothetical protein E0L35_24490 [Halomonas sp. ATBC28]
MQNIKKYFGFEVKVSNFLHPEDFSIIKDNVISFANSEGLDLDQYRIYLHQLVILANESHFGLGGGLPARVENVLLKFSVNYKQKRDGDIIFKNNLLEEMKGIKSYTLPHEICYTIPPAYFLDKQQFQNAIVTFVSNSLRREDFKKIKVCVSANATEAFRPLIKSNLAAESITNLDLPLNKGVNFDSEITLKLQGELGEIKMPEDDSKTTNIFNIQQAGAVSASGQITTNNNLNQQQQGIPSDHVIKEMKHLQTLLDKEGYPESRKNEVEALTEAIQLADSKSEFIPKLKEAGSWLADKAEKVGVSLVAAAIKGQLGL